MNITESDLLNRITTLTSTVDHLLARVAALEAAGITQSAAISQWVANAAAHAVSFK